MFELFADNLKFNLTFKFMIAHEQISEISSEKLLLNSEERSSKKLLLNLEVL